MIDNVTHRRENKFASKLERAVVQQNPGIPFSAL